jgi:hypothetical protein
MEGAAQIDSMKSSIRFSFSALIITFLASGCGFLPETNSPTFIPEEHLPTVIEMTAQAMIDEGIILITPVPPPTSVPVSITETPVPTDTQIPPTPEPEFTPTETIDLALIEQEPLTLPNPLPCGEIQLISPGRLSRVTSPFSIHAYLAPPRNDREEESSYQVSLYGDDGRLLVRHFFTREAGQSGNTHLVMEIIFEVSGDAEAARLEISSLDEYGRISALATTDLILLSEGDPEIKAVQDLYENLIIQQPISSTLIQGDVLIIQGVTRFAPKDQLLIELMNREGGLVGSVVLLVSQENLGSGYRPFEGEIPYQVGISSWIRVQVTARDGKFSGIQHLSSVEVLVSP